jgi:hypothetical protein
MALKRLCGPPLHFFAAACLIRGLDGLSGICPNDICPNDQKESIPALIGA